MMKFSFLLCILAFSITTVSGCTISLRSKKVTSADLIDSLHEQIEFEKCTPGQVTSIDLAYNELTSLPIEAFQGMTNLTTLDLENNKISILPSGVFQCLTSLYSLRLEHNLLTTLPSGIFQGLVELFRLYLHNNLFTTIPSGLFQGLITVHDLTLHDNQLTSLPSGLFQGLSNLHTIALYKNQLTTLPSGIFKGLFLRSVFVYDNKITSLPSGIFEGLASSDKFKLEKVMVFGNAPNLLCTNGVSSSTTVPGSCRQIGVGIEVYFDDVLKFVDNGTYGFTVGDTAATPVAELM